MSEKKQEFCRGFVKQVLSGDTVTISRPPRNGPPEVKTIHFDSVSAPKLGRKIKDSEMKDEPYAWESREFLRKKIIGQQVLFTAEAHGANGQLYGSLILGTDPNKGEDVVATMISEGWLTVKNTASENYKKLEEQAKAAKKGMHKDDKQDHIRDIKWAIEDVKEFVEKRKNKPIKAIIENVRDGSTVHAFLLPDFYRATVMIHGIRAPGFGRADENVSSQVAEEAKFFVECRLLNRDVDIILMDHNGPNLVGTIRHEKGNIAEALVKEGFARIVGWSLGSMKPQQAAALRGAESEAKKKRLRIWKDYVPPQTTGGKEYSGTVVEIVNADALVVKLNDGNSKKIFLSSIRPPRERIPAASAGAAAAPAAAAAAAAPGEAPAPAPAAAAPADAAAAPPVKSKPRPLYDIPYMFEAREYLRSKLIGKKVNIVEDYVQQAYQGASVNYPEKVCCTVTIGGVNVAETLVSKGLATVVQHRRDDDQRSSHYDALQAAEAKAIKSGHGMHSKKPPQVMRVVEVSDATKAKTFLRFLRGSQDAIVEYVSSGSRFRLFLPKETRIISFLLAGVTCQRPGRPGTQDAGTIYGEEATAFSRERCMQRDVKITVEANSGANFTGYLFVDGRNLAVDLAEEGLASVHFSAEKSEYNGALKAAETRAKEKKLRIWKDWKEEEHVEKPATDDDDNEAEAALESLPPGVDVILTELTEIPPDIVFYAQSVEQGPKLEKLAENMRQDFQQSPPMPGTYTPKKGDLCAAKFVDGEWYRARVEKVEKATIAHVLYIDYGNRHQVGVAECALLPARFSSDKPFAEQYALAGVQLLPDADYADDAKNYFKEQAMNVTLKMSVVSVMNGITYATLIDPSNNTDLAERLLSEGYLVKKNVRKMPLPLKKLYANAQAAAKKDRIGIWRYGDILADDAKEFGVRKEA